MPKTDNSDKWIIVSIFVQPANLKTNLIFGAAWGEAENQDKVDKWINARDFMLPGRAGERDKVDKCSGSYVPWEVDPGALRDNRKIRFLDSWFLDSWILRGADA